MQHPDLALLFQQIQMLVAQIKTQVGSEAGESGALQSSDTVLEGASQLGGALVGHDAGSGLAMAQTGVLLEGHKKEHNKGGGVRQRSAPYPGCFALAKEEQETQPHPSSGRDLGLEGESAAEFDSQVDWGQQLP